MVFENLCAGKYKYDEIAAWDVNTDVVDAFGMLAVPLCHPSHSRSFENCDPSGVNTVNTCMIKI